MQRPGIVGDHDVGSFEHRRQLCERCLARQIERWTVNRGNGRLSELPVLGPADENSRSPCQFLSAIGQFGEMVRRPALGQPACSHAEHQPGPRLSAQESRGSIASRGGNGNVKTCGTFVTQGPGSQAVAIDGVQVGDVGDGDDVGVGEASALARRCQTDAPAGARRPAHDAAAQ